MTYIKHGVHIYVIHLDPYDLMFIYELYTDIFFV